MKLGVDISPDLAKLMAAEIAAGQRAVTQGVREVGEQLKADWRKQITGAGLGQRLALTIRSRHYPAGRESFGAAAMVWSKAPQIVAGHDEGALLRSADGFWLAIPTPAAKQMFRREQATPAKFEERTGLRLRLIYRKGRPGLLVADELRARSGKRGGFAVASKTARRTGRGLTTVPMFILVPQVKLPKRLDLARDARKAEARLADAIVGKWIDGKLRL